MKASAHELIQLLPGKITQQWPMGERFITAFQHGSISVEFYAPVGAASRERIDHDPQMPHPQDELYFIHSGTSELMIEQERHACAPGMVFFVPAGAEHRFENFSADFTTWIVFWGPQGGETS